MAIPGSQFWNANIASFIGDCHKGRAGPTLVELDVLFVLHSQFDPMSQSLAPVSFLVLVWIGRQFSKPMAFCRVVVLRR